MKSAGKKNPSDRWNGGVYVLKGSGVPELFRKMLSALLPATAAAATTAAATAAIATAATAAGAWLVLSFIHP